MLWRGATEWPAFLTGRSMIVAGGMRPRWWSIRSPRARAPDRKLTNWAVVAQVGDGAAPPPRKEDWSRPGRRRS